MVHKYGHELVGNLIAEHVNKFDCCGFKQWQVVDFVFL